MKIAFSQEIIVGVTDHIETVSADRTRTNYVANPTSLTYEWTFMYNK